MNKTSYFLALAIGASLSAPVVHAQDSRSGPSAEAEKTFFDFQVDQVVRVKSNRAPVYPEHLRAAAIDGTVLVQFIVDERGVAQMETFKVIKSTDADLTSSVRRAVSATTYFPAEVRGQKVRQLVQAPFIFASRK